MKLNAHNDYFKSKSLRTLLVLTLISLVNLSKVTAQINNSIKIHVGLIYPLSSNGKRAPLDTNDISFNLIAGVSSEENGFSFAGITNVVRNNTHGTQFAGFSNHIGKKAKGALFAGFANTYHENNGVAFAGFGNIAHGHVKGAQFAGFINVAKSINGTQFAGFLNTTTTVKDSQFAGFLNLATNVKGSQMAGFMNKARDVNGSQFAGFINIARKVKGTQIAGFINIAESSDCPIGILNFIKKGEKSLGLSIDENQTSMLTFRSGGRILYGVLAAGYNFRNSNEVYAFEAGFGAHFLQYNVFRLNSELTAGTLENFKDGTYFKASLKLLPSVKIVKHIEFFGGPSINFITTNSIEGKVLAKKTISTWQSSYSDFAQALTFGYSGGLNIIF